MVLALAIIAFWIAVFVSSILIIVDAFALKTAVSDANATDVQNISNRLYIYAIILLSALVVQLFLILVRWWKRGSMW